MEKSDGSSLPFPGCEPLVRSPKSVKPLIRPSTHDVPINGWVPTWNTPIPRVPLRSPCLPDLQCFNCHFFTFTGQRMFVGNRRAKIERLVIPSPYVVLKSDNMQSLFQNWDAPKSQLLKSSFPHANGNKVGPLFLEKVVSTSVTSHVLPLSRRPTSSQSLLVWICS